MNAAQSLFGSQFLTIQKGITLQVEVQSASHAFILKTVTIHGENFARSYETPVAM